MTISSSAELEWRVELARVREAILRERVAALELEIARRGDLDDALTAGYNELVLVLQRHGITGDRTPWLLVEEALSSRERERDEARVFADELRVRLAATLEAESLRRPAK